MSSDLTFLTRLEGIIQDRIDHPTDTSYTAKLVAAGEKRVAQKVGEEAVEVALAAIAADADELLDEAADLVFHLLILLRVKGFGLGDVVGRLESRHGG